MILGSDLIYDFEYFTELVETLKLLYVENKSEIIFCYTHRFSDVERWFREELTKKGFQYSLAPKDEFDSLYQNENIHILKIFI